MFGFRQIVFVLCAFTLLVGSCKSPHYVSKKRRKAAPCDCPKFNMLRNDAHKTYIAHVDGDTEFNINKSSGVDLFV